MTKPSQALNIGVHVAFDDGPLVASPTFTDLTSDVDSWSVRRGSSTIFTPPQAGSMAFNLDDGPGRGAGNYDPDNSGGAYSGKIGENLQAKITANPNGTELDLSRCLVDTWVPVDLHPSHGVVTVTATDLVKLLQGWDGSLTTPDGGITDVRVGNVLDDVGVPVGLRSIDTPAQTPIVARDSSTIINAWNELQLMAVSEAPYASVYVNRSGEVVFLPLHSIADNTRLTTVQATFSNLDADHPNGAVLASITRGDYRMQRSRAVATISDGTVVESDGGASIGVETFQPDYSQLSSDLAAQGHLDAAVVMFNARRFGPKQVDFTLLGGGSLAEDAMGLDLRDRVRVKGTSPTSGESFDQECIVLGLSWSGDRSGRVDGSLTVVTADIYDDLGPDEWLILDDATRGLLDTGRLGY